MERGAPRYTLENHYSPQTATNETHYRLRYGTNVMIPVEVEEPLTGRPLFQQKQNKQNMRVELETIDEVQEKESIREEVVIL